MLEAASIRYNNPGAMWGRNAVSRKWGETATVTLNDGLKQGNNIAFFPTKVQGAAAQFDLWRTSYKNMTLGNAIMKWSGGNWSQPYADFLVKEVRINLDTPITVPFLQGPGGLRLMKCQAQWEAGKPYPLTDEEWQHAQEMCFGTKPPMTTSQKKTVAVTTATVTTAGVAVNAAKSGAHWALILGIIAGGLVGAALAWWIIHRKG